jgi:predicted molibdopterin-dependent oxidoreductase YjgC
VQLAARGLYPKAEARPTWEILLLLAAALGLELSPKATHRELFDAMAAEVPAFAGMTFRRLSPEPGIPILEEVPHVG